jgi:alanine-glyoxylate transaminase/serine-glyoxylate transaminase/serine-pyruvate transaminase
MLYGLHEALGLVFEEGIDERYARHADAARHLWNGLEARGFEMLVEEPHRLFPLTSVRIPDSIDDAKVRAELLDVHGIEIGGGLGPLAGAIWRIGLMGQNANKGTVDQLLHKLDEVLD